MEEICFAELNVDEQHMYRTLLKMPFPSWLTEVLPPAASVMVACGVVGSVASNGMQRLAL